MKRVLCVLALTALFSTISATAENQTNNVSNATVCINSKRMCVDSKEFGKFATTAEWRKEYICYKNALCEVQSDGQCGFTPTEELSRCLKQNKTENRYITW
jgi:hypothetical protein